MIAAPCAVFALSVLIELSAIELTPMPNSTA
jgi:hypothetical protein